MKLETIAVHAGNTIDEFNKAVVQPITLSTTFERSEDGGYAQGYIYTRSGNPNRKSLEAVLAQLEGGVDASAFASGNAAGAAVFQALEKGSHIIAPEDMYHGLRNVLNQIYQGILEITYVDMSDEKVVRAAIKSNTKLIWIETPSNPLLKISDIATICDFAKKNNILVCVDNTFATPLCQRPFELGADLIMHSTTKYLGGHSDVLGGALVTNVKSPLWEKIRKIQELSGAVPSPFDCYMTVRGIKTFPYRMKGHLENAERLVQFLTTHKHVEKVYYPGLASHPLHDVAKKQMKGFGPMFSFLVKGGATEARKVVNGMKLFTQATSLGGVESLIEHRASVEGPATLTPQNLLRVSPGLEHIDDLIADLEQALALLN